MDQTATGEKSSYARDVKMLLNYVVEAFQYSSNIQTMQKRLDESKNGLNQNLAGADELMTYVDKLVKAGKAKFGEDLFSETATKLTEFSGAAIDQFKNKLSLSTGSKISETEGSISSEKTKFQKSIESYLSTLDQPLIQRKVRIKWANGTYDARAIYSSSVKIAVAAGRKSLLGKKAEQQETEEINLEYEFFLRSDDIDLFKDALSFSDFEKGLRIPVRHAVSWISKEAVLDMEKVDRYFLSQAEVAGNNLIAEFEDEDKDTRFKFVFTRGDSQEFLNVEFADSQGSVDLSSQPALAQGVDEDKLKSIMKTIFDAVKELLNHRAKLASLVVNSENIIGTNNASLFLASMIKFLSAYHGRSFHDVILEKSDQADGNLSMEYVKTRLDLLGAASAKFLELMERDYHIQ